MAIARTYIKKQKAGSSTYDVLDEFGFTVQDIPFVLSGEVKDVESNDFLDEHGEEEPELPSLKLKAYEMSVTFIIKGTKEHIYSKYMKFQKYLLGFDNSGIHFIIYSDWHGIGRGDARLVKIDDGAEYSQISDNEYVLKMTAKIKVNDPVTEYTLNDSKQIVEVTA